MRGVRGLLPLAPLLSPCLQIPIYVLRHPRSVIYICNFKYQFANLVFIIILFKFANPDFVTVYKYIL